MRVPMHVDHPRLLPAAGGAYALVIDTDGAVVWRRAAKPSQ